MKYKQFALIFLLAKEFANAIIKYKTIQAIGKINPGAENGGFTKFKYLIEISPTRKLLKNPTNSATNRLKIIFNKKITSTYKICNGF